MKKATRVDVLQQIRKDRVKAAEKKAAANDRIAAALEERNELERQKVELLRKWVNKVLPDV